ncbi:hypothetical protein [Actinotalea sp.]|uniref:hypothetical protein n=1 Tax=Actinotalea sp. TaxID=1872145 RepID=UPI0035645498
MVDSLAPDGMAEAIERARFSLLRQGGWDDLREGERATRIEILRNALDNSGVSAQLQSLESRANQASELADLLERRDEEFRRRLAQDDAEIVRLSDRIAALDAQLEVVTSERDAARSEAGEHAHTLAEIRGLLDGDRHAEVTAPATPLAAAPAQHGPRRGTAPRLSIATGT